MKNEFMDTARFIDKQAKNYCLYHFNGAQAYVRASRDSSILLIIDMSDMNNVTIETILDASDYFLAYANYPAENRSVREALPLEAHYALFDSRVANS